MVIDFSCLKLRVTFSVLLLKCIGILNSKFAWMAILLVGVVVKVTKLVVVFSV